MANHPSSAKRARQNIVRAQRNASVKSQVKSAVKAFHDAIVGDDKTAGQTAADHACRLLRKAGSKGVMHPRTVSRRVARLAKAQHHSITAQR